MIGSEYKNFRVAYILITYPTLTKTFVDREIHTLHQMGMQVDVFSLRRSKGPLSPSQQKLAGEISYLFPAGFGRSIKAHVRFLLRSPWRYATTLAYLLSRPHPTVKSHWRTLNHFHQGVYTASLLANRPVTHVHAHFLDQSATIALVTNRLLGIPYSVTVHASRELFSKPMMVQEKLREAKFIATCTKYNSDYLKKMGKEDFGDRVKVVYHGLDVEKYQRHEQPAQSTPVILSVGQLRERKGFPYLVEACKILMDRGLRFECRIVGEGPQRGELEEQIRSLGLNERVLLCGALSEDEVIAQYQQSTVFTLPAVLGKDGDRDGIPNVLLEAMAMELPIVSTRHSAIPEVIVEGQNGLLVEPGNASALAEALNLLLVNQDLRRRMGRAGRETVRRDFDPQRNALMLAEEFTR